MHKRGCLHAASERFGLFADLVSAYTMAFKQPAGGGSNYQSVGTETVRHLVWWMLLLPVTVHAVSTSAAVMTPAISGQAGMHASTHASPGRTGSTSTSASSPVTRPARRGIRPHPVLRRAHDRQTENPQPGTNRFATLTASIDDIKGADFSARGIRVIISGDGSADLRFDELVIQQRSLRKVDVHCNSLTLTPSSLTCRAASMAQLPGVNVAFSYRFATGDWHAALLLQNTSIKRLANLLPVNTWSMAGRLDGKLHLSGDRTGLSAVKTELQLLEAGFGDDSGLHAAEKLHTTIQLMASREQALWNWHINLAWHAGELFWQPLYLKGGHMLDASGSFDGAFVRVEHARLDLPEAGSMQLSARWDLGKGILLEGTLHGNDLALAGLFNDYAKPFFDKSALSESSMYGHASVFWDYRLGTTQSLHLDLRNAGIADADRRFALLGINSKIAWQSGTPHDAILTFAGGALLGVPLGAGQWVVRMNDLEFMVKQGILPVLDGKLTLRDFRLQRTDGTWQWQFAASLDQVSIEQFSKAAGWPEMFGVLAGSIPSVSYDGNEIIVDGALSFNVFDGNVAATHLKLLDPFGRAPHLSGNLEMRGLDLGLLTQTFSFGSMQGRIDVIVNNLELQDWQPASFDARLFSSIGNYPKKISQKAVQNISALGGAGAAAAIQRSYLRFFENFGYDSIGWSCVLRHGICAMGGIDDTEHDAYAIVRGGGIPAITVMGYNRRVSWQELITRLKRITQGNMQSVVK